MKVSCIQMDMRLGEVEYNYKHVKELIRETVAKEHPDVVVLPETWDVGFFPKEGLEEMADNDGLRIKDEIGALARELKTNLVAGSVANLKNGKVYNTAFVFDRNGDCVYTYDKIHLFTYSREHDYFAYGDHFSTFELDGVSCGLIICYDVRFPELTRSISLKEIDVMFVVSQWPTERITHLDTLTRARAIENQMFVVSTNSCGTAYTTKGAGGSTLFDPWGVRLAHAGEEEEIISAQLDLSIIKNIRDSINVFRDRKPELYQISQ